MRRSPHRSRSSDRDSGQIRLDFDSAAETALAVAAAPSPLALAAVEESAAGPAARIATVVVLEPRAAGAARSASRQRSAAEWFELGCELEASSPAEAQQAYRRAVEADDRHADAHLNLGRLLHEAGDLPGAERGYRRALELEPEEATAAFNLGVVLEDLGRDDEAVAAYERAVRHDPDFDDAYDNLVRLHERRRDRAAALRVLKRLRERRR
jgi:Tfp pilus assembly protein PilF